MTIIAVVLLVTCSVVGGWATVAEWRERRRWSRVHRAPWDWEKDGGVSAQPRNWRVVDDG